MKTQKQTPAVHLRWMIRRDMDEVMAIESTFTEFAWDLEVFLHHLRHKNVIGMVAEHGEKIIGYMVYALESSRLGCLNFVVHPQWRRLGVGRFMMEKMESKLSSLRRTAIALSAHERNLGLQLFLRAMGFRSEGVAGEFYLMTRRLPGDVATVPPNRIARFLD